MDRNLLSLIPLQSLVLLMRQRCPCVQGPSRLGLAGFRKGLPFCLSCDPLPPVVEAPLPRAFRCSQSPAQDQEDYRRGTVCRSLIHQEKQPLQQPCASRRQRHPAPVTPEAVICFPVICLLTLPLSPQPALRHSAL